jgi:CRISPR/Cas system-associated exonuclease Cas4 (RecB family)
MADINRRIFLDYLDCPTLGWISKRKKIKKLSAINNDFFIYELRQIRQKAYKLFPDAIDASNLSFQEILQIMQNPQTKAIFNLKVSYEAFVAKADILSRDGDSNAWNIYEIKTGKKHKAKYSCDLAYSVVLLEKAGLKINDKYIMCISSEYKIGKDEANLFSFINCNQKVEELVAKYSSVIDKARQDLISEEMPKPYFKRECKNCPVFDECIGKDIHNTIFNIPKLSVLKIEELINSNVFTIDRIPDSLELNHRQTIIKQCHKTNSVYISPDLKMSLEKIKYPCFYLDFESMNTVIPLYVNFPTHCQILTQFSIDKCDEIDKPIVHFDYIADHKQDCQKTIAAKLIEYLGDKGSIIVYSDFEKIAIQRLANLYPKYQKDLIKITDRIIDFAEILSDNYYDIRFKGRTSMKVVLPIMNENMNYDNLEIGEGAEAAAAFAFMAAGIYDEEKCLKTKENLLKYCAQDTMALVKIHKFLYDRSCEGKTGFLKTNNNCPI